MTNSLSVVLGLLIVAVVAVDLAVFGTEHVVFLGKKLFAAIEWLAFWR